MISDVGSIAPWWRVVPPAAPTEHEPLADCQRRGVRDRRPGCLNSSCCVATAAGAAGSALPTPAPIPATRQEWRGDAAAVAAGGLGEDEVADLLGARLDCRVRVQSYGESYGGNKESSIAARRELRRRRNPKNVRTATRLSRAGSSYKRAGRASGRVHREVCTGVCARRARSRRSTGATATRTVKPNRFYVKVEMRPAGIEPASSRTAATERLARRVRRRPDLCIPRTQRRARGVQTARLSRPCTRRPHSRKRPGRKPPSVRGRL